MRWKMVPGFGDRYRVSDTGRIQHLSVHGKWREVNPSVSGVHRAMVSLYRVDGTRVPTPITRLVADLWMGGVPDGYCVIHLNGSKLDNDVTNLKIVTRSEACRMSSKSRRRSVEKLDKNGNVVALYRSAAEAAKKNYLSPNAMASRCRGEVENQFKFGDYAFRYESSWAPKKKKGNDDDD